MASILVRDLDEDLIRLLKERARRNRRSAEAEHRAILQQALRPSGAPYWETAARLRDETRGRGGEDGAATIRRFRDEHGGYPKP